MADCSSKKQEPAPTYVLQGWMYSPFLGLRKYLPDAVPPMFRVQVSFSMHGGIELRLVSVVSLL